MVEPLGSIVIVGGGTAGWMAAAMLRRFLPRDTVVRLVESDEIGTVGVGEATIPQIRLLVQALGLDEDRLLAATGGTIKLGIEFDGWSRPGERYLHAFGQVGRGLGVVPFHHWWLRGRALGLAEPLAAYTPAAVAAAAGRFARGGAAPLAYAYHLDAGLLARELRRVAEAGGVERIEGRIAEAVRADRSDHLAAVRLADGRQIAGDFFVDCSGFRGLLIGDALGIGVEDWSRWLPCDRAVAVASAPMAAPPPYTRALARAAGWQWRIPLQHRTGNGHVYEAARMSDDEAAAILSDGLPDAGEPRLLRFAANKRRSFWVGNTVAIGLASGFLEPLESTSIHLVQSALARLLALFPASDITPSLAEAYNRQTHWEVDRVRDFLILHYLLNDRDEPFWQARRTTPPPDGVAEKLRQFRAGGQVIRDADELFAEPGWLQVMVGQGLVPDRWSPLAEAIPPDALAGHLAAARDAARRAIDAMPTHAAFLASNCPMEIAR